jgi:spermidine/putrescine transport system permease protein
MSTGGWIWRTLAWATIGFMVGPLLILVLFAFSESPLLSFPITGLSLKWIAAAVSQREFMVALRNSMIIISVVGAVSSVVGTMAAIGMTGLRRSASSSLFLTVLTVPLMVPPLMLAVMQLSYFSQWLGLRLGLHTVILSHLVFTQPIVILIVYSRLAGFDRTPVDAARDLGASAARAFFTVTLPIIRGTVLGAALIAMALSLDDFLVTFFTIGGGNTLPTFMWGMLRRGVDPSINVIATLLMLLSVAASVIGLRITRYRG